MGTEVSDQSVSAYNISLKSPRWYANIFPLFFESAIGSRHIFYREVFRKGSSDKKKPFSQLQYKQETVRNLVKDSRERLKVSCPKREVDHKRKSRSTLTPEIFHVICGLELIL